MDRPNTRLITIEFKGDTNSGNYTLIENSLCTQYTDKAVKSLRQQQIENQNNPKSPANNEKKQN
jgi:hypothetical protein